MVKGIYPGVFDLLHPGHLFALDWAREHCDHLTAAINIDPTGDNCKKEKPIESAIDRFVRLLACKFVDNVTYYKGEKALESLYRLGDYDLAFISIEHESSYTSTYKAKPVFVPRLSEHSSTRLRKKIRSNGASLEFLTEHQHRICAHWMEHQFSLCQEQADGSIVIPADKVAHWKQQLATPYCELSEAER